MGKEKEWMKKLMALEGAVIGDYNPFAHILDTDSPSLNFIFGNSHGLPKGYSLALWGKQKSGKSLITNMLAAKLHKDDPTAWVIKFNTEGREDLQFPPNVRTRWGIDNSRYVAYEVNQPALIFDRIETELMALVQDGMNIGLVIIDSTQNILGRRTMNADTVNQQQIGDQAATLQAGLQRILQTQRKCKFGLVLVMQARGELDPVELMRHKTIKMGTSFAVKHYCEYFVYVEKNESKEGRQDILGNPLWDESLKDMNGNAEQTGHKIKVHMQGSSAGVAGRVGEFSINYKDGVINAHEEVFKLGVARGIIAKPTLQSYSFDGKKWIGKPAAVEALRIDKDLQKAIIKELKKKDLEEIQSISSISKEINFKDL